MALACQREARRVAPPTPQVKSTAPVPKSIEAKTSKPPTVPPVNRDLDAIVAAKTLNVVFTFNSTGYFIYRGRTMGYEYDLLNLFARENNLRLNPVVIRDSKVLFDKLNEGDGDVVAAALAATTDQTEVATTDSLYSTAPVVVQRAGGAETNVSPSVATAVAREQRATNPQGVEIRARLVTTPAQLAGETVHVPRTSP